MKLLQINVWQGRLLRPLLNLIREETPDLIFTQEIYTYPEPLDPTSPWNHFRTLERITELSDYAHTFFSPSTSFDMFGHRLEFGNAILSKYPLRNASTHYTGGPGPVHMDGPGDYDSNLTRNFQHAVIDTGRSTINLINHHGHWVNQPLGDEISVQRLQNVAKFIAGLKGAAIVGGDFNLSPDSSAMTKFIATTNLCDQIAGANITTTLSPAHYVAQPIICDYILTTPDLNVTSARVSDRLVSDHRAVIAEIDA